MVDDEENVEKAWPVECTTKVERGALHWLILLGCWGSVVVLALLAFVVEPDPRGYGTHEQLGLAPCRLMERTGLPCPGCGVTTAIALAVHGELWQSIVVQPLGLLTAIALPLLAFWALIVHLQGGDLYEVLARRQGTWIRLTLLLMGLAWGYKIVSV